MHLKIMRYILTSAISLCVFLGVYFVVIFNEAQNRIDELGHRDDAQIGHYKFEEGGSVLKSDFDIFSELALIDTESLKKEGTLSSFKSKYVFNDELSGTHSYSQKCDQVYCLYFPVKFDQLATSTWKTLMGIEDYRFLDHKGIDPKAILRAAVADIKAMKIVQGGSTLTQQLVKNLFLSSEKKIMRKVKELIYAKYLEANFSKDEIILMYLNNVEWGSFLGVTIRGIKAASLVYFGKEAYQLTSYESAIIIGMLKGPNFYHPYRQHKRLKSRTAVVFARLLRLGLITEDQRWTEREWKKWLNFLQRKKDRNSYSYRSFLRVSKNNYVDSYKQFIFSEAVQRVNKKMEKSFKGKDVAIKGIITPLNCERDCPLFSYYSKAERNKEKAISSELHQVGSTLKPIIYQALLNEGVQLNEKVSTKAVTLKLKSGTWKPKDSSAAIESEVSVEYALQKSKNIPLIRLALRVGFESLENRLIHQIPNLKTPLSEYPAQLLGAVDLTMKQTADVFKNYYRESCSTNNNSIMSMLESRKTTVSGLSQNLLNNILIFGKTGTTNRALDNWYVAIDGINVFLIWTGLEGRRDNKRLIASGATTSFRIFQDYLENNGNSVREIDCKGGE